jgi:putative Holliday junction resolvase
LSNPAPPFLNCLQNSTYIPTEITTRFFFFDFCTFAPLKLMGRIIAIDYGQKRVGLAVTDELKIIATSLATIPSAEVISFLKDYLQSNQVDCFVVGEPRQMDYSPSESEKYIEPFIRRLRAEIPGIPVERVDERFTSLMAVQTIRDSGAKRKTRQNKALVDTVSATIMLQSYLEMRPSR